MVYKLQLVEESSRYSGVYHRHVCTTNPGTAAQQYNSSSSSSSSVIWAFSTMMREQVRRAYTRCCTIALGDHRSRAFVKALQVVYVMYSSS